MNDVKSMPFEHIVKAKNPCIPPKYSKSPRFGKLREIRQPFFNLDHEKWKPQILQQIAQNPLNSPTHTANHVKLAQFTLISKTPCSLGKIANFTAITQNPPSSPILTANHAELAKFGLFLITLLFLLLDISKTGSNTMLARIT